MNCLYTQLDFVPLSLKGSKVLVNEMMGVFLFQVKNLTDNIQLILDSLRASKVVEVLVNLFEVQSCKLLDVMSC